MSSIGMEWSNHAGGLGYGNWNAHSQVHGDPSNGTSAAGQQAIATSHHSALVRSLYGTERTPLEDTGLKVGEIIGYRMWRVRDGYLVSYSTSHAWLPNEVMKGDPKENNDEGIWAFKEKSRALNKMLDSGNAVMGSIKMWGRIIEYTQGYRSEFAKITSLDCIRPRDKKFLRQLQEEYGL